MPDDYRKTAFDESVPPARLGERVTAVIWLRALLRGPSVVCHQTAALQALAWGAGDPAWRDDQPAPQAVDAQLAEP